MKHVVAVSGGVDSVVLLDMMAKSHENHELVVAHFDHGIRAESADDAKFVAELATRYGLVYETEREELGAAASEEVARNRRYAFLRRVAKKHDAMIVTAHHADDVVESIAINLKRGTGWRGLAVMDSLDIERPLLRHKKAELLQYAKWHNLEWREDSTNTNTKYLRNDIRQRLEVLDKDALDLLGLYRERQVALKALIDKECQRFMIDPPYSRYFFTNIPSEIATEILREIFIRETGESALTEQRNRALHAIKTYPAGKRIEVAKSISLLFTRTTFIVEAVS